MSFTVEERYEGRKPADGDSPSNEIPYLAVADPGETGEEEAARAAIRAQALADYPTLDGLTLKQVKIEEALPGAATGFYHGRAVYGSPDESKDTGESSFNFDTTGGTFKVTHAISQTGYPTSGDDAAPDLENGINVNDDGVEGVDITIPQYAFSETHYIDDSDVDDTFKGLLFALTGTKNDDTFKGCAAGECLFLGARGSKRGRGDWEITFMFAASPNVTGLMIGSIGPIAKLGWDYLWVAYQKKDVGAGQPRRIAPMPVAVYVAKVYEDADFSLLGIGTT